MADKLEMMSDNIIQENIDYIASKFPNALKEVMEDGKLVKKIDFDVLKQELSTVVIDDKQERYQMTWPDKKKSILLANSRINATLRPDKEKSVDFDNTKNLYIEGDNLDVLKLLRETYLGKIKMIYIDPPYNTGNDFVYEDDFAQSADEYLENSGQYDEQGNRLNANSDSNGRFHTDWLNMMLPRLKVSKDLLSDDGAIFISIDDCEVDNLKKVCNEVFGAQNFLGQLVWRKIYGIKNDAKTFSSCHEYILVYSKSKNGWTPNLLPRTEEANARYKNPDNDPRGPWKAGDFTGAGATSCVYEIISPSGKRFLPPEGKHWIASEENYKKLAADNRLWFGPKGENVPSIKRFLSEVKDGLTPSTFLDYTDVGHTDEANRQLKQLMEGPYFDYPKPVRLLKHLLFIGSNDGDIVLDFFSGSGTTGHACFELSLEKKQSRKFIMIQLPEICDDKTEAYKAGYNTICEIGEERIRRAGKQIKEEAGILGNDLDVGFRVLKLDSSNMTDVYYNPNKTEQNLLDGLVDNVKEGRTPLDLLFQVMLELGIELSAKIEEKTIAGKKCFIVNENDIVACFDNNVSDETVKEMAKIHSIYAVFKDSGFASDSANINCEQIFKSVSPSTNIKII